MPTPASPLKGKEQSSRFGSIEAIAGGSGPDIHDDPKQSYQCPVIGHKKLFQVGNAAIKQ